MRNPTTPNTEGATEGRDPRRRLRIGLFVAILLVTALAWPVLQGPSSWFPDLLRGSTASGERGTVPSSSPPAVVTDTPPPSPTVSQTPDPTLTGYTATDPPSLPSSASDLVVLSLEENGYARLYAYHPQGVPFTRLTEGAWNDITPALSPDGEWLAFSSDRGGGYDIFLMEMATGEITRLTDTLGYDGAPSWSPDGMWLVHETYLEENLELVVRPVSGEGDFIRLTSDPGADQQPSWSPGGRHIAFVSSRSGDPEIWLADLDRGGAERFTNLSQSPRAAQTHPAWSPDGNELVWVSAQDGIRSLLRWERAAESAGAVEVGGGDWPTWSPDGQTLITRLLASNRTFLTAYDVHPTGTVSMPPVALPGALRGITWGPGRLPDPLPTALRAAAGRNPDPLWLPRLDPNPEVPGGRRQLIRLEEVSAPHPELHDLVDESFTALKSRLAAEIGWDLLSTLENAFVPLTSPLSPGMSDDWLYTGRAFAFTTAPMSAGWMVVVREDIGPQTYWRVFLRTRFQDGSQGVPLHDLPWDLSARYQGAPRAYEAGGALSPSPPAGYWLDFTALAAAYGWERLPALSNWRTYYQGARFNEFALTSGIDWRSAMLELYPPEVLVTPTAIVPPTRTITPTPRWFRTPTPSVTPTPLPTLTPAWTPPPGTPSSP